MLSCINMNPHLIILLVIVSTLMGATLSSERIRRRAGEWGLHKISCRGNAKYVKNDVCSLKSINRNEVAMSVGSTILSEQTDMNIQVQHWQKMNSNRYMPGMFNVKGDLCDLMKSFGNGKSNVLKSVLVQLDADFQERYKVMLHPCPFLGPHYVYNTTLPRTIKHPLLSMFPTADYKIDIRILSKDKEEMYLLTLFGSDK